MWSVLLKKIKESGRKVILATSKPQEFAETILKHFHIDGYFDHVAGATMDGSRGEKADVIAYALEISGIEDKSQAIIGVQMACAYVGTCFMPPIFGVIGDYISMSLVPVYMLAILVVMFVMHGKVCGMGKGQ